MSVTELPRTAVNHSPSNAWYNWLKDQWFLISVMISIPVGIVFAPQILATPGVNPVMAFFNSQVMTFIVLFLMSWTLNTSRFRQALTTPVPVLLALVISYGLLPFLGMFVTCLPISQDLHWGLMIALCVPTTLATASVYTRQAGGNDAISLVTTLVANLLCPFVTPFLFLMLSGKMSSINQQELFISLLVTALLPTLLGQILRVPRSLESYADKYRSGWSFLAQCGILYIIFRTTVTQASIIREQVDWSLFTQLFLLWMFCLFVHALGLLAGFMLGRICACSRVNTIAIIFSGSQKTLPVAVYLAATFSELGGFLVLPIIINQLTQIVVDSWVVNLIKRQSRTINNKTD